MLANKSIFSILVIVLTNHYLFAEGLKCYTCSTSVGDSYCSEDTFDKDKVPIIECPDHTDVCVRLKKVADGAIFRSCGTSSSASSPEITDFGFYPLKNSCINYKSSVDSIFPNAEFEVCSCSKDLSNTKGALKC